MATLERGNFFPPKLVEGLINQVKGASSLARLTQMRPIPFNGYKEFTFTMDSEIDVVAESGKKSAGSISLGQRTIVPLKVEYGARVSDEFMYASEEEQIDILKAFNDGFSKKLAKGLDLMAFHGVNPRTGNASGVIGANNFKDQVTQTVAYNEADPDASIQDATDVIRVLEGVTTGIAMAPKMATDLGKMEVNGVKLYPEFKWGNSPDNLNGLMIEVNPNVNHGDSTTLALVGDFAGSFRWGYAKNIPMEIIEFGDPDNSGMDLKGYNQIYIRCEAYLGWGILAPDNFVRIESSETGV